MCISLIFINWSLIVIKTFYIATVAIAIVRAQANIIIIVIIIIIIIKSSHDGMCDYVYRGMEELFAAGSQTLTNLLENTHGGVMLICGIGGGGEVGGCGKTSLAHLLCRKLMESDHKAHLIALSCTLLRG